MKIPEEFKGNYKARICDVKLCEPYYFNDPDTGKKTEFYENRYQLEWCKLNRWCKLLSQDYRDLRENKKIVIEFKGVNLDFIIGPINPNLCLALEAHNLEDLSKEKLEKIIQQLITEKAYTDADKIRKVVGMVLSAE